MKEKSPKVLLDEANAAILYYKKLLSLNNIILKDIPVNQKITAINEIRQENGTRLSFLLKASELPHATYQYQKNKKSYIEKNQSDFNIIKEIFLESHKKYGVPRIQLQLATKYGVIMNKKKIAKLMKEGNLRAIIKPRRKYNSYKGEGDLKINNLINRNFSSTHPLEKITTDVTEFKFWWGKCYLQVYLDMFNSEVLAFEISKTIPLTSTLTLLNKLINAYGDKLKGTIVHSDRGWQYQESSYQAIVKKAGMIQSMSHIANALDNAIIESFYKTVKEEFFKGQQIKYQNFTDFYNGLVEYLTYYNNDRILMRLKTSPIRFRLRWEKQNGKSH